MQTGFPTLASLASDLAAGRTSSRTLVEEALDRIDDTGGEGSRAFVHVDREQACLAADAMDRLRRAQAAPSAFAGIPISVKDLFDVAGQVTRAGSRVLAGAPAASKDAVSIARLKRAGFVIVGRTNMTEFAFSGLGINPHFDTPRNSWDRTRVPGGSSSGAAISVVSGMAHAGIGTDTGGSCRIPAAFNSIVGYKPTAARIPLDGTIPLSSSLDSIGPLARSVACCAAIDTIMAGGDWTELVPIQTRGLRLGAIQNFVLSDMDIQVGAAFERALKRLAAAGVHVEPVIISELDEIPLINAKGGLAAAESFTWHRQRLEERPEVYDPRVSVRIRRGVEQSAADYIDTVRARKALITSVTSVISRFDALVMPTVPVIAPTFSELAADADYSRINALVLRNPTVVNMFDGCAISIPMQEPEAAPAGMMLAAGHGLDHRLFRVAAAVEGIVRLDT